MINKTKEQKYAILSIIVSLLLIVFVFVLVKDKVKDSDTQTLIYTCIDSFGKHFESNNISENIRLLNEQGVPVRCVIKGKLDEQ